MLEKTNESQRDSISIEKNSKNTNYSAKCYLGGSGDLEDTEVKMKARLDRYVQHLESTYGNKLGAPGF